MVKPKRIGHLVLNVKDVEASTKFYTEILGFEISLQRPDGFGNLSDLWQDPSRSGAV